MAKRIAALFDIDGTLIITGGAGAGAWRLAFEELYGERTRNYGHDCWKRDTCSGWATRRDGRWPTASRPPTST
jgi:beta-phosphoglucomutase-like phosphatase (HAD superfamily)